MKLTRRLSGVRPQVQQHLGGDLLRLFAFAQVNLSFDRNSRGYRRDGSRPAPYNVIGDPKALLARAEGSVKPRDIGFRYGPPSPGGKAGSGVTARWPSATVALAWNAARKQYLVTTDGRPDVSPSGKQYGAGTEIEQG